MPEKFEPQPEESVSQTTEQSVSVEQETELDKVRQKRREKSIENADETTREFMEEAEGRGIDWNSEEFIHRFGGNMVWAINKLFGKKYGLSVPEEALPVVLVDNNSDSASYIKHYEYVSGGKKVSGDNIIGMPTVNDILNGNTMSEELAHFYRCHLEPAGQANEDITQEFFGFLGAKLWGKIEGEETFDGLLRFLAGHEMEQHEEGSKKGALAISRFIKKTTRAHKEFKKLMGLADEGKGSEDALVLQNQQIRRDWLIHQRGYEWASRVDMDKITDWKKLFSMPNEEVRKRFFTDKPDYSGL